jgi:hypothetical protein
LDGSRKRVAKGNGVTVQVNQLLTQQMQKMMKQLRNPGAPKFNEYVWRLSLTLTSAKLGKYAKEIYNKCGNTSISNHLLAPQLNLGASNPKSIIFNGMQEGSNT